MSSKNSNSGFSIVEVVVAAAVIGVVVVASNGSMMQSLDMSRKLRISAEQGNLREIIRNNLSCGKTLNPANTSPMPNPPAGCSNLHLLNASGTDIFPGNTSGEWQLQLSCASDRLVVKAYSTKTKLPSNDSASWVDLFANRESLCFGYFKGATIPTEVRQPIYITCMAPNMVSLTPPSILCNTPVGYLMP